MREILFRGKCVDDGEWIYGYLLESYSMKWIINPLSDGNFKWFLVDNNTICQYTGLTDKNGNKIWENDILRGNNDDRDLVKVVFGEFGVIDVGSLEVIDNVIGWHYEVIPTDHLSKTEPFCLSMPLTSSYVKQCKYEVIGNVFDNKELLEE